MSSGPMVSLKPIRQRLAGQRILVTGATGFLAKAFVEKLLRTVDTLEGIDLLVRSGSDGLSPRERAERDVFGTRAFDRLRASLGAGFRKLCEEKVRVVPGDLTKDRLGLSPDEYEALARRITLVVNSAATVTFDERVDWAVELNARGPGRLLRFAQDAGNVPFLHVSTCYVCGARHGVMAEDFSAPEPARETLPRNAHTGAFDFEGVLASLLSEAQDVVDLHGSDSETSRKALIEIGMRSARRYGWNDTYTFTKWIGEQFLIRDRGDVPLAVFRPAIIESSLEEPMPGWIDGLRMADPVIVAYGRGKLREFPGRPDTVIDFIPVDFVANAMIAALPVGTGSEPLALYQCASSDRRPLLLRDMLSLLEKAFQREPMGDERGQPIVPPRLRLLDAQTFLRRWRRKQRRIARVEQYLRKLRIGHRRVRRLAAMSRQIDQILYFAQIYAPYTHLDCRFADDALGTLRDRLDSDDRQSFPFDAATIDWEDYFLSRHVPGLRGFVLGGGAEPSTRLRAAQPEEREPAARGFAVLDAPNLFEAFRRSAVCRPDKTALQIRRDGRWLRYSYREALLATGSIMQRLTEFGLSVGDRMALSAENGPEWGLAYLAAMRAGLTAVPLDPQLPPAEAWSASRFVGAKLMCAGPASLAALRAARGPDDPPVVELRDPFIPPPAAARDRFPDAAAASDIAVASILFTSGTALTPRAVPLTHRNLLANAAALSRVHPISAADEFLSVLPMYHVFEFTAGFLIPLVSGATITYVDQLKGPVILSAMQDTGTTIMLVVPRLLRMFFDGIQHQLAESGLARRAVFSILTFLSTRTGHKFARQLFGPVHAKFGGRLRMFVSGGSRLDPDLSQALQQLGFTVHEGYGMTETSPVLTVTPPGRYKPGSVGPPLPNVELEVRHANADGVGDVWVRGPAVMSGYLNNASATQETFLDGWLRTGDLGRLDEEGYLYLTGRSKDLIVTGAGKNVYPDELEALYGDLPYTKELCVFGMPAEHGLGDVVHAVVVLDPAAAPELDRSSMEREVRGALMTIAESLPSHQRIQTLHFWSRELPKTSTLKAKRGLIREMVLRAGVGDSVAAEMDAGRGTAGPESSAKHAPQWPAVQRTLSKASKRPAHSIQPDMHLLLDLGIDSIGKIELLGAIEATFGLRVDDETGARIARVADLLTVIGDRLPAGAAPGQGAVWRRWLIGNGREPCTDAQTPVAVRPLRWLARGVGSAVMHSYLRIDARGRENIPGSGPFILAPNHSSHLDAPSVLTAVGGRRRVWVAAAEDYFFDAGWKRFVFGRFFDAVAVDRETDGVKGLRRCADVLQRGDGLLIFPEGTRSLTGHLQPFKGGVAILAAERQVPILPVHIERSFELLPKGSRWPRPGVITVTFGKPIQPPKVEEDSDAYHDACRRLTREVESAVSALANGARR